MSSSYDPQKILEMAESMGITFPDDLKQYLKSSEKKVDAKAEFTLDVIKNAVKIFERPSDQGQVLYAIPTMYSAYSMTNGMDDNTISSLTKMMSAFASLAMALDGMKVIAETLERETSGILRKVSAEHPEIVEEMKKVHERIAKEKHESEKSKNEAIK
jgi:hypothetical protein